MTAFFVFLLVLIAWHALDYLAEIADALGRIAEGREDNAE